MTVTALLSVTVVSDTSTTVVEAATPEPVTVDPTMTDEATSAEETTTSADPATLMTLAVTVCAIV